MNESYPEYIGINTTWINKIRDEGFIFTLSYCNQPKRAPSRFSLGTGGYPSKSQESTNGTYIEVPAPKIASRDAIYNIQNILKTNGNNTPGFVGCHLLSEANVFCGTGGTAARTEFYYNSTNKLDQDGFDFVDKLCISNINKQMECIHIMLNG